MSRVSAETWIIENSINNKENFQKSTGTKAYVTQTSAKEEWQDF